jgi:hypothetical protein
LKALWLIYNFRQLETKIKREIIEPLELAGQCALPAQPAARDCLFICAAHNLFQLKTSFKSKTDHSN